MPHRKTKHSFLHGERLPFAWQEAVFEETRSSVSHKGGTAIAPQLHNMLKNSVLHTTLISLHSQPTASCLPHIPIHSKRGRHMASAACLPRFNIFGNIFPIVCYWLLPNRSGLPACSQQAFRIHSFCHVFTKHVRASSSECRACRSSSR